MRNPFEYKKIRCLWDKEKRDYWYSANDVIKLLTEAKSYQAAKSYWKYIKRTDAKFAYETQVFENRQVSLPSRDGKAYLTDVIDAETIVYLISMIKHKACQKYRLFMLYWGKQKIKQKLTRLGAENQKAVLQQLVGKTVQMAVTRLVRVITFEDNKLVSMVTQVRAA